MQGFNRYYPPDYDPKDARHKGNLNRLAGKAAQKPVVRFEMPFNIWCLHCQSHIAQGVRFNAHKEKTGAYFTSPIFSFSMKCHLCSGLIVIATNPKDTCYDVVSGGKKRSEEWNAQENDTFDLGLSDPSADRAEGPIYKLEKDAVQRTNIKDAESQITQLMRLKERQWGDSYAQSQKLRRIFRTEKKALRKAEEAKQELQNRHGMGLEILDQSSSDRVAARSIDFENSLSSGHGGGRVKIGGQSTAPLLKLVQDNHKAKHEVFSLPLPDQKRVRNLGASPTEKLETMAEEDDHHAVQLVEYDSD